MDYLVRATAAQGQIRAFATTTKDMVEFARAAHDTSPVATAALGRTLTGGVMMGSMMKGDSDVLTLQITGDLRTFTPRRRTQIEHPFPRLYLQKRHHCHGAGLLNVINSGFMQRMLPRLIFFGIIKPGLLP